MDSKPRPQTRVERIMAAAKIQINESQEENAVRDSAPQATQIKESALLENQGLSILSPQKDSQQITKNQDEIEIEQSHSEDDDDSVNDPNFSSTSSSRSSSSPCSSCSSSSSTSSEEAVNDGEIQEQEVTKIKTRKRFRKEHQWQKNKLKRLRNEGKEYVSSKSRKVVIAKAIKEPCGKKCYLQCSTKFTDEQRQKLFKEYYSLSDINKKRNFLLKNVETVEPKYRYVRTNSNRRLNFAYFFHLKDGNKIRVCKIFFKKTLDINDRTIQTVRNKSSFGFVKDDLRGKHDNHKKVHKDIKEGVRKHINSIPRIESHYLRAQTSKEFIDGAKTIAQLHRDYESQCRSEGKPSVNYHMYSDIFNSEYNISFYNPKKDQCSLCFQYDTAQEEYKENLKVEYEEHLHEKNLSRIEKDEDKKKNNENLIVACFDMQAIMQIPKGEISIFYYKSKLSTMNFTITELGKNEENFCYVWHEGEGGKGATEVGTCLFKYLEEQSLKYDNENLEVVFYSDNCGAQQKNRYIIALFMYAVQALKIKSITLKYLIVGHTQNEGDATHSTIEKQVSRSLKSGPIFVPDQFVTLIRIAKKKGQPYRVTEMTHEDFYNVKQLMTDMGSNFNTNTNNEPVAYNALKMLKVKKEQPFLFFYKNSYADMEWNTVDVRNSNKKKTTRTSGLQLSSSGDLSNLQKAYKTKLPLNENKKKDLKFLLDKGFIPSYYRNFYNSLF